MIAGNGNFFGLHGAGPAGTYWTKPTNPNVKSVATQKFPGPDGFQQSGNVFVTNVQPYMQPAMGADPQTFFTILNHHGYASGNPAYPGYMVQNGYNAKGKRVRGPYTLVSACL